MAVVARRRGSCDRTHGWSSSRKNARKRSAPPIIVCSGNQRWKPRSNVGVKSRVRSEDRLVDAAQAVADADDEQRRQVRGELHEPHHLDRAREQPVGVGDVQHAGGRGRVGTVVAAVPDEDLELVADRVRVEVVDFRVGQAVTSSLVLTRGLLRSARASAARPSCRSALAEAAQEPLLGVLDVRERDRVLAPGTVGEVVHHPRRDDGVAACRERLAAGGLVVGEEAAHRRVRREVLARRPGSSRRCG